jgi:hypothetical protein
MPGDRAGNRTKAATVAALEDHASCIRYMDFRELPF